jgi:hypothetical protein
MCDVDSYQAKTAEQGHCGCLYYKSVFVFGKHVTSGIIDYLTTLYQLRRLFLMKGGFCGVK